MNISNASNVTAPSPVSNNYTAPSPASVASPSPVSNNNTTPSPASVTSPSPVSDNYTTPSSSRVIVPSVAPSPTTTVAPFDSKTPSPYVPSTEEVALQQFLLAFAACLLCLFLMFRNKERIMKRTFQSRKYTNIVVDDDTERLVELSRMPQTDDISYMEEETDDEKPEDEV